MNHQTSSPPLKDSTSSNELPLEPAREKALPAGFTTVPPEEVARRIAEYREVSFEHKAPAQVVYHPPHHFCPWPGCGYRIAAIAFQLEKMGNEELRARWLEAWWRGPGLVGVCPGCGHPVLFGLLDKQPVADSDLILYPALPDNWYQEAYFVPRPQE